MAGDIVKIIILLGPPGSGKGTQAEMIGNKLGLPQVSTGDMLRSEKAAGTELGRRSSVFMDRGELVPDEVILEMVNVSIRKDDCMQGFILDGFPRTVAQAESLDRMLGEMGLALWRAVYFDVPDEEIVERLTGRLTCVLCGKIYHVKFNLPPSKDKCECGGYLMQRPDDNVSVVTERLRVYKEETSPVIIYYSERGVFNRVHGGGKTIDQVHAQVMEVFN